MQFIQEMANKDISTLAEKAAEYPMKTLKEMSSPIEANIDGLTRLPRSNGEWTGEAGKSIWNPNRNNTPQVYNPDNKSFGEILDKYGVDGIPYKDGYPDFTEVSRGTVEIGSFTPYRDANFIQANEAMAKERGCSPEEVKAWMKEHGYTWHECEDCKTMMKVPSDLHDNIPHVGGISIKKDEING